MSVEAEGVKVLDDGRKKIKTETATFTPPTVLKHFVCSC